MTFSTKIKHELCEKSRPFSNNSIKLLYGLLLFSRSFKVSNISFYTENKEISDLASELIMQKFNCIVDIISSGRNYAKKNKENIILKIPYEKDRRNILKSFGYLEDKINIKINTNSLKTKEDTKLFLRGVFLSCGNLANPKNDYHLEFSVSYMNLCKSLFELINSIENLNFKVKSTVRKGNFIIYIKNSSNIIDFLTYIGASLSAMDLMQIKMLKEVRNYVNRTTNFEAANITKIASAATTQIKAIKKIKRSGHFNYLDENLKELANLRIKNPEMSLRELGENLSNPITRSSVNHKMKKLLNISEKFF